LIRPTTNDQQRKPFFRDLANDLERQSCRETPFFVGRRGKESLSKSVLSLGKADLVVQRVNVSIEGNGSATRLRAEAPGRERELS